MNDYHRLREVTPNAFTTGIFTALDSLSVPWHDSIDSTLLNMEYYGNVSGLKLVSPLVFGMLENGELSASDVEQLASVAVAINGRNWAKQYATMEAEYDPISNYDMREQLSDDITTDEYGHRVTRTDNLSHTKTGTDTRTDNLADNRTVNLEHEKTGTDTRTDNLTDTRTANLVHGKTGTETKAPAVTITNEETIYGFNSSDAVPANGNQQVSSGQETTTYNTQETDTGTDTTTHTGTSAQGYNTTESDTGTDNVSHTGTSATQYNTTESDTGTDNITHTGTSAQGYNTTEADTGTVTNQEGGTNTKRHSYTLTRSGNIGVTTSQMMLESERNLWIWNFFRQVVFPDLDYILTIPTY